MSANAVFKIETRPAANGQWHSFLGDELIATGHAVEFVTCRILDDRGVIGVIETWHQGASYPSMRMSIDAGAKLSVTETNGPRFVKYRPFPIEARLPVNRPIVHADLDAGGMHPSGQRKLLPACVAVSQEKQNRQGRTPEAV